MGAGHNISPRLRKQLVLELGGNSSTRDCAVRWEPCGLIEDYALLQQQQVHQRLLGIGRECNEVLLWSRRVEVAHALLKDASALTPEGQRHGLEIPQDGTQGP